jgi:hypothetical protein
MDWNSFKALSFWYDPNGAADADARPRLWFQVFAVASNTIATGVEGLVGQRPIIFRLPCGDTRPMSSFYDREMTIG